MDKDWKLQRYTRKNYGEVVDFPVEIVGRDGLVRRYSFEDSIRLYQRRITFAPIRYRDDELVDAEVHHCQSRIDQLRRSYFHRFGWGTPVGQPGVEEIFGDLAGELAAFVCRVLHSDGRPAVRFERVRDEENGQSAWYLTPEGAPSGMLLYAHRFATDEDCPSREAFFDLLRSLEEMGQCEGDGERLLAFHHTIDCGFALTGQGSDYHALLPTSEVPGIQPELDLRPTPWDEVLELVRRGAHEVALARCRAILDDQPWHRSAYIAGAMLALVVGDAAEAHELTQLGVRYFPEDGELHHWLGVSRSRQDQPLEAIEAFAKSVQCSPERAAGLLALVLHRMKQGQFAVALQDLQGRVRLDDKRGREARVLARLDAWLRWRRMIRRGGWLLGAVGLLTLPWTWLGLVPAACGLSAIAVGGAAFERQMNELHARPARHDIRRQLRRLVRRRDPSPVVS